MLDQIRTYLTPPTFENPEEQRRATLLNSILVASAILITLFLPVNWATDPNPVAGTIFLLSILLTLSVIFLLLKAKHLDAASSSLIAILWTLIAASLIYLGGVTSSIYISLFLIVYAAGLIISTRAAYLYTGLTLIYGGALVYFEMNGQLSELFVTEESLPSYFAGYAIILVMLTVFTGLSNADVQKALRKKSEANQNLEEANQELSQLRATLEDAIEERTANLQKRRQVLEAISSIVKDASTLLDPQLIVEHAAELIGRKFGYYHVGIFLIDNKNEYAILRAASSQGGKSMIERNYQLQVGKQGVVGFVTGIGQPRLAQDVSFDRYHASTTELPDTRSELAIPLKTQGEIIGALDIQENIDNAFTEDDITMMQTMADQIALVINNAKLYQETQDALEETRRAYGEYSQKAWIEAQKRKTLPAYRYTPDSKEIVQIEVGDLVQINSKGKVEVPVSVRGQVIGTIDIAKDDDAQWTEEEMALLQTLSDQIGTALDGARLFGETQQRATIEKMIGNITAKIRESLDLHSILQNTAETIRESMELPVVTIQLADQTTEEALESSTSNGAGGAPNSEK